MFALPLILMTTEICNIRVPKKQVDFYRTLLFLPTYTSLPGPGVGIFDRELEYVESGSPLHWNIAFNRNLRLLSCDSLSVLHKGKNQRSSISKTYSDHRVNQKPRHLLSETKAAS